MNKSQNELLSFLKESPTAWQAVEVCQSKLSTQGFHKINEQDSWNLNPGQKYVTVRNGSSLCAFVMPKNTPKKVVIVAAHTDSPSLKLKPHAISKKDNLLMVGVEVYGGPLLNSWLNRDLGIAGRITYLDNNDTIQEANIVIDDCPITIPQLAIHLDREIGSKGLKLNPQDHLNGIIALSNNTPEPFLENLLKAKVSFETLLGHDLYLYPLDAPRLIGWNKEFISSYRIDNLLGVHACLNAILSQEASDDTLKMALFWDNEEVGSSTPQGAGSPFSWHVLERIIERQTLLRIIPSSLCISVDLAHALHPNYREKHDPEHRPLLGEGITIKYNAKQRYVTDAKTAAIVEHVAKKNTIKTQKFASRADIPCGSTIGPIHAARLGMPTVDIGVPQLSMHAARELAAVKDHLDMCLLLTKLLEEKS